MINFLKKRLNNTPRIIFLGFLSVILIGAIVLSLPICSADGRGTPFVDSLFTSTTSVCVTGLVTVPTYSHWSAVGKVIILILIQLGGLGVICIATGFLALLRRRISLASRKVIQESYNLDTSSGMVALVLRVIKTTILIESLGAAALSVRFIPQFGWRRGIIFSIFHSISAFCNAGIDLLGDSSLMSYVGDTYFNVVIMLIIISGGLGFIVWWEIVDLIKRIVKGNLAPIKIWERMTLHSKIVISMTVFLLITGVIIVMGLEYDNPKSIGNLSLGNKVLASSFQSVTLRTAGFCTVSQTGFKASTSMLMCIFMLIGGSPVGTAGGIKTTTVAIILIEVVSVIRGKEEAEVFRRRISKENVRTAITVATISVLSAIVAMIVLSETEGASIKVIAYEVFSAIGTVGLSMDFTSSLSVIGKYIIILLMFMGRIGPITLASAFAAKQSRAKETELPIRKIIIG
ncbi:MAG: potassium transporter KtrB [Eubacterium sp.]|nr:potassium transporter KtrB [Eubacterium sp.]